MQSVLITTKVGSETPAHDEVYSIQHYVIQFFLGTSVSSTNKTGHHDITEILLKVALNTITLTAQIIHVYLNKQFYTIKIYNYSTQIFSDFLIIFQLYHDENKLLYDKIMTSVLD